MTLFEQFSESTVIYFKYKVALTDVCYRAKEQSTVLLKVVSFYLHAYKIHRNTAWVRWDKRLIKGQRDQTATTIILEVWTNTFEDDNRNLFVCFILVVVVLRS